MKKFKEIKGIQWGLAVVLAIQLVLLIVINLFLLKNNLDCDNGKSMTHIIKMWEHRTLAIPNWNYVTTLEWDCTDIFALPLYALTGNIFLSVGISNVLLTIMFLFSVYYLLKDYSAEFFLLAANLMLIPYGLGMLDYYNMMFFGVEPYIVKVTTVLFLVGILNNFERSDKKWNKLTVLAVILYGLCLLCTSMASGIYVAATGIAAIILGYALYKLMHWEKLNCANVLVLAASLIIILAGIVVNQRILGGSRGESMILCSAYQIQANTLSNFWGIFELMGGLTKSVDTGVFSAAGVEALGKVALTIVILVYAFIMLRALIKKSISFTETLLTILFFWDLFIMLFVKTQAGSSTSEYRYHLMGIIPLLAGESVYLLNRIYEDDNPKRQSATLAIIIAFIVIIGGLSYYHVFSSEDSSKDLKEIAEYFSQEDLDVVYLYEGSNDSDVLKVLDQSKPYICLLDSGQTFAFGYYDRYCLGGVEKDNSVVLINNAEYSFEDTFMILDMTLEKVGEIAGRSIYVFI